MEMNINDAVVSGEWRMGVMMIYLSAKTHDAGISP